jgi:hypothetical protein
LLKSRDLLSLVPHETSAYSSEFHVEHKKGGRMHRKIEMHAASFLVASSNKDFRVQITDDA